MSGVDTFHGTLNPPAWMLTLGDGVWRLAVVAGSDAAPASDKALVKFCNLVGKDVIIEEGSDADRNEKYARLKSGSFTSAVK